MALWYFDNKNKQHHISTPDLFANADAYLCCSGPSLKDINPNDLKIPGATVVAVNNTYPFIKPDIWIGMDDPMSFHPHIYWEPFIKIMRGGYSERKSDDILIKYCPNLWYADCASIEGENDASIKHMFDSVFKNTQPDRLMFIWTANVMSITLHILMFLGFTKIHLIGSDLSNKNGDHYSTDCTSELSKPSDNTEQQARLFLQLIKFYDEFNKYSKPFGVNLISSTPNSPLNEVIQYIPLSDALEMTKQRLPEMRSRFHGPMIEEYRDEYGEDWLKYFNAELKLNKLKK